MPRGANPPHVYAMADRVHRALTSEKLNQSVIVSGESGAGKTETCKAIMKFLLAVRGDGSGRHRRYHSHFIIRRTMNDALDRKNWLHPNRARSLPAVPVVLR